MTDTEMQRRKAICDVAGIDDIGKLSDGFHTFDSLYEQRLILFAALVKAYKNKAWKSYRHEDGEYCFGGGWFIVGIDTPEGSYTYHYENKYWDMFDCIDIPRAKHWDGHTEADAETRLMSLEPKHTPERTETHACDCGKKETHGDTISRRAAIDALWKALYEYEDKTEKQFIDSEELDVADWIQHRIFVQNMSDIDRQTILDLPSAEPESEQHSSTEKDYAYCSECDNEEPCRWCIRCMRVHRQIISEPERKTGHHYCGNCGICNGGKNEEADIS